MILKMERIKGFNEAYERIKKLRLQDMFIFRDKAGKLYTWKDVAQRLKNLEPINKETIKIIEKNIEIYTKKGG